MARRLHAAPLQWASGTAPDAALPSDPEALGALLAELTPRMTAVALRFTRDRDAAADVVQNAFEKVCRHRRSFRGQSKVSTWVHRIVANEALMWIRAEARRRERSLPLEIADVIPDPADDAERDLLRSEERLRVGRELGRLRPAERDLLDRCALAGVSYEAYGRETGSHPAAVKSRAFRARRRLQEALSRS